jgi:cytochrome bd-type quinol oxidase subunit 2
MAMSMGTQKTLMIMFIATAIFAPIVLGYQVWKYVRFNKKVNYNDEEEA